MAEKSLSITIGKNTKISLTSKNSVYQPNDTMPVYAINWFNTKRKWLYRFYNLLALRSVLSVGAK
ncbi:MAG: hypothetical protein WBA74_16905, partial [Cyclobacteriaceae bacterium]